MYTKPPTAQEAAAFGLTLEEASGDPVAVWPDNMQSVNVFIAMSTQWMQGFGGPTGLNYASLPEVWRRTKTPIADRDQIFDDLRMMEDAALEQMRKG